MTKKTNAEIFAERMAAKHGPDWKKIFSEAGKRGWQTNPSARFARDPEAASEAGKKGHQKALERHGEELFAQARIKATAERLRRAKEREEARRMATDHPVSDGSETTDKSNG